MKPSILWLAYAANVVILVPVAWSMFASGGTQGVFEGRVADSPGLRLLVGSIWLAMLLASVAGFLAPRFFAPVLLIQIAYKATWLGAFVVPLAMREGWGAAPHGIAVVFAGIVATYPVIFWLGMRS